MHKRNKHNAACTSGQEQTKGMASEISWIRLDSQYFEQNSSVPIGVPANSIPSDLIIISVGSCNRHNSMSTIEGGMYMLDFCMLIESPHSDREWLNLFQSPKSEKAAGSTMKLISSCQGNYATERYPRGRIQNLVKVFDNRCMNPYIKESWS